MVSNQQSESSDGRESVAPVALASSEFLRTGPAAEYLRKKYGFGSASTLNKMRVFGGGPPFYKVGKKLVIYKPAALDSWAMSLMSERVSTSDSGAAA